VASLIPSQLKFIEARKHSFLELSRSSWRQYGKTPLLLLLLLFVIAKLKTLRFIAADSSSTTTEATAAALPFQTYQQ
jgi:hypothetical protein